MRKPSLYARAIPVLLTAWLALMMHGAAGCNDDDPGAEERRRLQEDLRQTREQLDHVRRQREQDRRVLETRKIEAESDSAAAIFLWVATAAAFAVVLLLLTRERHLRGAMERFLALVMPRSQRGPP